MFSAGKIVAIDDEKVYLTQIADALNRLGIACLPVHYPEDLPSDEVDWFRDFRIVFCDLHLVPAAARAEQNYQAIGSLLDRLASKSSAPFLMILWTAYAEDKENLHGYLRARHADSLPIEILALSKSDFGPGSGNNLAEAIRSSLDAIPQLRALYEWQDDVAEASHACVGTLIKLATGGDSGPSKGLDKVLSSLAVAATGVDLAARDPSAAIHEALAPLLSDRLAHLPPNERRTEKWAEAMPAVAKREHIQSDMATVALINTAMLIVRGSAAQCSAHERGAVTEVACPSLFKYRFGAGQDEIVAKFALKEKAAKVRWVGVQVEAACDYAQQKSPCLPYVLAIEIAADAALIPIGRGRPDSVWESPIFISDTGEQVKLIANVRYVSMISSRKAQGRKAIYRLRDTLVTDLAFAKSRHEMRPGFVALR